MKDYYFSLTSCHNFENETDFAFESLEACQSWFDAHLKDPTFTHRGEKSWFEWLEGLVAWESIVHEVPLMRIKG